MDGHHVGIALGLFGLLLLTEANISDRLNAILDLLLADPELRYDGANAGSIAPDRVALGVIKLPRHLVDQI